MWHFNEQGQAPKPGPSLPIVRVTDAARHIFTVFSPAVWGVWTHWDGRRSVPCMLPVETCPFHRRQLPLRWKGYVHVFDHNERQQSYLELTPAGVQMLQTQLAPGESLRGILLNVERSKGGPKGRLIIEVKPNHAPSSQLTEEKHPREALTSLWGLKQDHTDEGLNVSA